MKKAKFTFLLLLFYAAQTQAQTITDITGPAGSGQFGKTITVLPNGNYIVTDPLYDEGAIPDVGAVYLYHGRTRNLISILKGSSANDNIGSEGVTVLTNGNYLVHSPNWDNGSATDAGAITWCSRTKGVAGVINSSNSLIGGTANDRVGNVDTSIFNRAILNGITVLTNGNYVAGSPNWDNGTAINAGAVTWGNGTTGVVGLVSNGNSLVGSTTGDNVGSEGVTVLTNGNYLVHSPIWDNGSATDAGAITWCSRTKGVAGVINISNSLVGGTANDRVGNVDTSIFNRAILNGITVLTNGNYVVGNPNWDNGSATDAGAVTWGNGTTGVVGVVSSSNSLVGSTTGDNIGTGSDVITILSNGNYVVLSPNWDNGAAIDAGAVTWGSGTTGVSGLVSSSNSLVGSTTGDNIETGRNRITILSNGNYVVGSPNWDNGAAIDAGAVTWGSGANGVSGVISSINSLVGSTSDDQIGSNGIFILNNGNYVVGSVFWDNGEAIDAGAATWGNGTRGVSGVINSNNSLVGSKSGDFIGYRGIKILNNGNYVVGSPFWDNGAINNVGAATWGNGISGISGIASSANSLIGVTDGDRVGFEIAALTNGNYVELNLR
jgi:Repeat of unknown function (DUF5650)